MAGIGQITICDSEGATVSTLWQHGHVNWELLYSCIRTVIVAAHDWAIFPFDAHAPGQHKDVIPPSSDRIAQPGKYVLLCSDGRPISVQLTTLAARTRHPVVSNTRAGGDHYRKRVQARDPCCLITGRAVVGHDFSRFTATHIYPRSHDTEWTDRGFPSMITDPAPLPILGGPLKIDSIQNVVLFRSDVHDAFDAYKIGINADDGHVVIPFVEGYEDLAGKTLKLDHIEDPNLQPLDDLFRDHFLQGVLKNMKGSGEPGWDYEDALGDRVDLSRLDIWNSESGKEHLRFELAHRLHNYGVP